MVLHKVVEDGEVGRWDYNLSAVNNFQLACSQTQRTAIVKSPV